NIQGPHQVRFEAIGLGKGARGLARFFALAFLAPYLLGARPYWGRRSSHEHRLRRAACGPVLFRAGAVHYNCCFVERARLMTQEELLVLRKQPALAAGELSERIVAEKQGPVGWLTFNNPARRNAISIDMWEAIPKVLDRFEQDPEVRAIVLKGEGDKAFVSGADVSQYEKQRSSVEGDQYYEEIAGRVAERLQNCDKVIVAMIRGYCLGAGVNIALCCDLRIAAEDAKLGIPAAKLGLGYRASSLKNLIDIVGPAYAREVLITGRHFSAAEAKTMGLVHRVA